MTKPMTEAQFSYAVALTAKVYSDPAGRTEALLNLAGMDFHSISPVIDGLKAQLMVLESLNAPAVTTSYVPPKGLYVVDGKVYKIKTVGKYNTKMYVYGVGAQGSDWWVGAWGESKTAFLAKVLKDSASAYAAAVAYSTWSAEHLHVAKCGVCNTKLTDPKSIAAGIGPVCAKKYGM